MPKDNKDGATSQLLAAGGDTRKMVSGTYTFSSSYTTGGEDPGISRAFRGGGTPRVIVGSFPVTATVAAVKYVSGKFKAYVAAGTEVANGTNLSTVTVEYMAIGLE